MPEKFFRDPLYGFIGLSKKEIELLSTPFVQRLRRIKQLGNTHLVYPSACHSRFEHSLGVLYIATRMARKLNLSKDEIEIIRYAALLHDVGHGPLSHNFEKIFKITNNKEITHEEITLKIIKEDKEIDKILSDKKEEVLDLFDHENETVNRGIISSNIDADRLDYLRRDSYHTGVAYGLFDLERILHTINKTEGDKSYITILKKGKYALEDYMLARFLMHTQVYCHHVRVISDEMFYRAMEIAIRDNIIDKDFLNLENDNFLKNYFSIDDGRIFEKIQSNPESNASILINGLENRCLMKRGYNQDVLRLNDPIYKREIIQMKDKDFEKLEEKIANECGCGKDFIISYLQKIENVLFKSSYDFFRENETPILIESEDGGVEEIDKVLTFLSVHKPLIKFYIFCPPEYKNKVEDLVKNNKIHDWILS